MILALLISLIPLAWKLFTNYKKWIQRKPVNHIKEFWIVVMGYIIPGVLWIDSLDSPQWYAYPIVVAMIGFWFWFLFDGLYNKIRGFGFWFTGSDDEDDAKMDNLIQGLKGWQHKAVKIGGVLIFTILFLNL